MTGTIGPSGLAVGVDIGGTKIAAGLATAAGDIVAQLRAPTPARAGADRIVGLVIRLVEELAADHPIVAVGVGSAGVIDTASRRVLSATDSLSGWAGTELGRVLEDALQVPVLTVNDVHAHACGEAFIGAGRNHRTVLLAAVGTGIGGAIVVDGVPLSGAHGASGHLGHLPVAEAAGIDCTCGKVGHLEAIASGPALHRLFLSRGGDRSVRDARQVVALADTDRVARDAVITSATALGNALGGLVNVIDPGVVIIAGGMRNAGELWWSTMEVEVRAAAIPVLSGVPVVPAALGDNAAIIGAARLAFDKLVNRS